MREPHVSSTCHKSFVLKAQEAAKKKSPSFYELSAAAVQGYRDRGRESGSSATGSDGVKTMRNGTEANGFISRCADLIIAIFNEFEFAFRGEEKRKRLLSRAVKLLSPLTWRKGIKPREYVPGARFAGAYRTEFGLLRFTPHSFRCFCAEVVNNAKKAN